MEILFIQTGGTIDKVYPRLKGGYHFEIEDPAFGRILARIRPGVNFSYNIRTLSKLDSQEITDAHRLRLFEVIQKAKEEKIIVSHGTDTIIQTADYIQGMLIQKNLRDKTVVLTGSFWPEAFKDSDADINVGMALGAVQAPGFEGRGRCLIALCGSIFEAGDVKRLESGQFVAVKSS